MRTSGPIALLVTILAVADPVFEPARFESGPLSIESIQPPMTGGGQVLLELAVNASGQVTSVTILRSTPPFADRLADAVGQWRFEPARALDAESKEPITVDTRVLVAGVFRSPTSYDAPALGEIPKDVASPSEEAPFPTSMTMPLYPPTAVSHTGRVVLVEVEVGEDGRVETSRVIRSAAGFDSVSLDAARQWTFRPARRDGTTVPSRTYIVFGFREPVVS